jgi:hypothetical protein
VESVGGPRSNTTGSANSIENCLAPLKNGTAIGITNKKKKYVFFSLKEKRK